MKDLPYKYSREPLDNKMFTEEFNRFYTSFAPTYDLLVKYLPIWRNWLNHALP